MDVACPQCGNPNLDVDEQNSVVYCRKCGFAVHVDQNGEVVPISGAGGGAGGGMGAPAVYSEKNILGTDPTTFILGGSAILAAALFLGMLEQYGGLNAFAILETVLVIFWFYNR